MKRANRHAVAAVGVMGMAGVVGVLALALSKRGGDEAPQMAPVARAAPVASRVAPVDAAVPVDVAPSAQPAIAAGGSLVSLESASRPGERDPVFVEPSNQKTRAAELGAMHFVYDACSKFAVFREGSKIESTYVAGGSTVNVSVKVANDAKVDGNVLWYRVDLDGRGEPKAIIATKTVAATACYVPYENDRDGYDAPKAMRPTLPKYRGGDECDGNVPSDGAAARMDLARGGAAGPGFVFDGENGIGINAEGCDFTDLVISTKQCNAKSLSVTLAQVKELLGTYGFRTIKCEDGPAMKVW